MEPAEISLERLRKDLDVLLPRQNTNTSTITVSAGGMGLWVAVTCCLVMLAVNIALLFMIAGHDRKIERMQDHLNAIYMMAPHLKPDEEKGKVLSQP